MHVAKVAMYMSLFNRLAAFKTLVKEASMTDTDIATVATVPADQTQPTAPTDQNPAIPTAQTEPNPTSANTAPKCTATATTSDEQTPELPANASTSDGDSPFIKTALAAANLIEQLRQHPEAYAFLDALLKCLEPPKSKS